jgi:hypothetical protein
LHPPSKADAVYAIPSRAPRLCVHQTGSRGGAEARRARAGLARSVRRGCTRRWKRALHVPPRGGAVGGTACRAPTPVAGSGRLAQRGRPGRGSTYLRTAINPLYRASRGAEALGYGMQSPPAQARPDYFFKDHMPLLPAFCTGVLRFQRTRAFLKGWVFREASAFFISFLASGRPNSPFSPCGRRGLGG